MVEGRLFSNMLHVTANHSFGLTDVKLQTSIVMHFSHTAQTRARSFVMNDED